QDALVFYLPVVASLAVTLFFLPFINAARRRSPIRFFIWLANWAVLPLIMPWGPGVIVLWLAAFVFSFLGGIQRASRQPQPPSQPQPQRQETPSQPRPAAPAQKKAGRPATSVATAAAHAVQRAARPALALNKREPTIIRRGNGRSW